MWPISSAEYWPDKGGQAQNRHTSTEISSDRRIRLDKVIRDDSNETDSYSGVHLGNWGNCMTRTPDATASATRQAAGGPLPFRLWQPRSWALGSRARLQFNRAALAGHARIFAHPAYARLVTTEPVVRFLIPVLIVLFVLALGYTRAVALIEFGRFFKRKIVHENTLADVER